MSDPRKYYGAAVATNAATINADIRARLRFAAQMRNSGPCLESDAANELDRLTRELAEAQDGWYQANGVAELSMKHRDMAESELASVRAENKKLSGLLMEWFDAAYPSIHGSHGSLLERTRNALYPVDQSEPRHQTPENTADQPEVPR